MLINKTELVFLLHPISFAASNAVCPMLLLILSRVKVVVEDETIAGAVKLEFLPDFCLGELLSAELAAF